MSHLPSPPDVKEVSIDARASFRKLEGESDRPEEDVTLDTDSQTESVFEKLSRLKYEVETFRHDLENFGSEGTYEAREKQNEKVLHEVVGLRGLLSSIADRDIFRLRPEDAQVPPSSEESESSRAPPRVLPKDLMTLETRTSGLEKAVGISSRVPLTCLRETVSELEERMKLFNPQTMDYLLNHVKTGQEKLEGIEREQRARLAMSDVPVSLLGRRSDEDGGAADDIALTNKRLTSLFESLQKWDTMFGELPLIVSRLKTLQQVRESSVGFGDEVAKVLIGAASLGSVVDVHSGLADKLEKTFEEQIARIEHAIAELDSRMSGLIERMERFEPTS